MTKLKIDLDFSLKRLDLFTKSLVNTKFLGNYKSAFKGTGLEFSDYRKYNEGSDDSSLIDWKASKRVNELLVKEFVEERNLNIIFLVDVSAKMLTSSLEKLKAEYIAEIVASLTYSMLNAEDAVGLILFSDKIIKFVAPQRGVGQYYNITNNLIESSNYKGYSNVEKATEFAFNKIEENSLVIIFSDFIYPIQSEKIFKLASKKFDLISIMVRDPIDMTLPEGTGEVAVEDPYSGEILLLDPEKMREEYSKEAINQIERIRTLMKNSGADFLFLETNKEFGKYIIEFFKKREAKWR